MILINSIILTFLFAFVQSYSIITYNSNNNNNNVKNLNTIKLPPIYWSSKNTVFNRNDGLRINARLGDNIDLICSKINEASDQNEYSVIYKVATKYEFDNCLVNINNVNTIPILKCDRQTSARSSAVKYTIYFVKYSPVPYALEFEENKEYYFLSTSSGTKNGLTQKSGGLCATNNMKFSIKILPDDDQETDFQSITTTPDIESSNDFLSIITGVLNSRFNNKNEQRTSTSTRSNSNNNNNKNRELPTNMSYRLSNASVNIQQISIVNAILCIFIFYYIF